MDLPSFMGLRDGDGSGGDLCVSKKTISPVVVVVVVVAVVVVVVALYYSKKRKTKKT